MKNNTDVRAILLLEGVDFLERAYWYALDRPIDLAGKAEYLRHLSEGMPKETVLDELQHSAEGRRVSLRRSSTRRDSGEHARLSSSAGFSQGIDAVTTVAASVSHVFDLLELRGEVFLRTAYLAVLGREIDRQGLQLYSDKLHRGWSRSHVVAGLAASEEAKLRGPSLLGIEAFVSQYRRAQRKSLVGWFYRAIRGMESDLVSARCARNPWMRR